MSSNVIDPNKTEAKWLSWRSKADRQLVYAGKPVSEANRVIILRFIDNLAAGIGINAGSKKGGRSSVRLLSMGSRCTALAFFVEKKYGDRTLVSLDSEEVLLLFEDIRSGRLLGASGSRLTDIASMAKAYTQLSNWWRRLQRKEGKELPDVCADLRKTNDETSKFVYLTRDEVLRLAESCNQQYRTLVLFIADSGVRAPKELANVRVSDVSKQGEYTYLRVRGASSKTFERRFKLWLSRKAVEEWIAAKRLSGEDLLFPGVTSFASNKYLQTRAKTLWGDAVSPGGEKYERLTLYDLRHVSVCLSLHRPESEIKAKYGWVKSDMIYRYSRWLGAGDTSEEADSLPGDVRTRLERQLEEEKIHRAKLEEDFEKFKADVESTLKEVLAPLIGESLFWGIELKDKCSSRGLKEKLDSLQEFKNEKK